MKVKYLTLCAVMCMQLGCANSERNIETKHDEKNAAEEIWKNSLPEKNANYGIFPEKYQEIIKADFESKLKDPESAKYTWLADPKKDYYIKNVKNRQVIYGYSACVKVNAKNSYGGYVGNKTYYFLISNNQIADAINPDMGGASFKGVMTSLIDKKCK